MIGEKIELYVQLWSLAKAVRGELNSLAKDSGNTQALADTQAGFLALQPYLPSKATDVFQRIFSGAKVKPEILLKTGQMLLSSISGTISKELNELLERNNTSVVRADAEKLFSLWDEIPHTSAEAYQWVFRLCEQTSFSMPLEAFQYSLRIFEEQPRILSGEKSLRPDYTYRSSEQRTFDRCPICGRQGTPYFRAFSYRMADFKYPCLPVKLWMKCEGCGNLYTWKYPEKLIKRVEQEKVLCPNPECVLTAVGNTSGGSLAVWSDILNLLSRYSSGKDLLEVGVGNGELLAVALEMGYLPDAVEISPGAAQRVADMLGIPIWCGDFLNYNPDRTYSIITMGDVIEHVTDPEKALRNAFRLLKEDGILWISTPNFDSSFSRMRKFNDAMWLEPYHISYFNRAGLEKLALKCGFSLREYSVSRRYNGSMEIIFTKTNK